MINIKKKNGENSKLKIYFLNPNSNEEVEKLLKVAIVEKIRNELLNEWCKK